MKTSDEVIEDYRPRIEEWLKYAYTEGYRNGNTIKRKQLKNLRSDCHREKGEHDEEYSKEWEDYTPFYGWCNKCNKPHSGRWAHVWEYCPWCGAKIDHKAEEPYPSGERYYSEIQKEIKDMCADINLEEIKSHDTEESLKGWCGAWNRRMNKLIKRIGDSL